MAHKCKCDCKHKNVAYCKKCGIAYCEDCPETWENKVQVTLIPYYSQYYYPPVYQYSDGTPAWEPAEIKWLGAGDSGDIKY
jgi:hypothetical protein